MQFFGQVINPLEVVAGAASYLVVENVLPVPGLERSTRLDIAIATACALMSMGIARRNPVDLSIGLGILGAVMAQQAFGWIAESNPPTTFQF